MPKRIQRKRTKGWRMPEGAVYVGRPTKWGNPWAVNWPRTAKDCRRFYSVWLHGRSAEATTLREAAFEELRDRDLACWCPLDQPCHADVLLELANRDAP